MRFRLSISIALIGFIIALLVVEVKPRAQTPDTGGSGRTATENYFGIKADELYDISFRQASLREVLQFLSWISELNIVIPEGLEGLVNVSFKQITISDAMNSIIKSNNLEYTVEGGIVRVGRQEQFQQSGEDLKSETFRLRYASSADIANKAKLLLSGRGSSIADERTNSVVIRDLPANLDNVRRFINDVDLKDAQVLIESKILEATRRFARALGIQWGVTKSAGSVQIGGVSAVGQADSGRNLNVNMNLTQAAATSGLMIGSIFKGTNLDVQILAAEQRGDAYIVSDPSIVTSNGMVANIRSGATLLIQSTSSTTSTGAAESTTGSSTGVTEKKTGVELKVVPQISINDFIKLDIEATTSTPDFSRTVQGVPIIVDNVAKTTVLVKDGETTVIGGLSRFTDALSKSSVPYLSRIPLLGNLFKSKERIADNTELMVFIKPTVIRVEGQLPAQMRIREIDERQDDMKLEPVLTMEHEKEDIAEKRNKAKLRRGNKYIK